MNRLLRLLLTPFRWLASRLIWIGQRVRRLFHFAADVSEEEAGLAETLSGAFESREAFTSVLQAMGEHLDALRRHLFRAFIVLAVTTVFSFIFAEKLMAVLAVPLGDEAQTQIFGLFRQPPAQAFSRLLSLGAEGLDKMQVIEPTEGVGIFMRVSLLSGLTLAMPWIVLEVYLFLWPGLLPHERRNVLIAVPSASLLFLLGVAFTFFVMLPAAIPFLYGFAGFRAAWRPAAYFNLVTGLMFWIGIAFQMPLLIYVLASLGWVTTRQLSQHWRIAVVVIAVIAAMVTPTVDPVNMGLVMLPMILLYFLSIVGAALAQAGRVRSRRLELAR